MSNIGKTTYNAAAAWLPTWKKIRLNWKLKVSNTADNAGITQSQVRYTRYRRMQKLNSLCVSKQVNSCVICRVRRWETLSSILYSSVSPRTLQPV